MPGANAKALAKAKTLPADVVILDLEDSVAPEAKAEARAGVVAALKEGGYGARETVARVNALASPWGRDDIRAVCAARPQGILVPKIESGQDVIEADAVLNDAGFSKESALWIMIETPRAILNLGEIAAAVKATRLSALVLGLNDLAKDTRMRPGGERLPFHAAMSLVVIAARAHGLVAIDGVYNHITDTAGFMDECRQALAFGFDGKTLIHPSQIDPCNMLFAPSETEVEHARAIIAAFAAPENSGKGVIKVDGKMTELLHLEQAKRVVAVAEAIQLMA